MLTLLIVLCGKYLIWLVVLAGAAFVLIAPDKQEYLLVLLASAVLAYASARVAGALWYDPLPFVTGNFTPLIPHAANNGFPSDHGLLSGVIASVVWLYNRRWGTLLWLCALVIGLARIAAGIHHTVDVAAAFLIAVAAAYAVRLAYHTFVKQH